jgi:hypothetical protein
LFDVASQVPLSEQVFHAPLSSPTPTCPTDNICESTIGEATMGGVTAYTYTGDVRPGGNFTIRFRQSDAVSKLNGKSVTFSLYGFNKTLGFGSGPGATDGDPTIFMVRNYSSTSDLDYSRK